MVDWSPGANDLIYHQAAANTRVVGAVSANMLRALREAHSLSYRDVHLIGHSLGAHICGYVGRRERGIGRITGMCNIIVFHCIWLDVCSHEQFFSYLATVTITCGRAANLDLCLALTAISSEDFTCHAYCNTWPPFLRSYPKDPWFSLLNAVLLAKKQSLPISNDLCLTRPARAGLELTTFRLLSESTTTRLRQQVHLVW
jgi:pimeloyl-ACP methyl ester carboxylesterase